MTVSTVATERDTALRWRPEDIMGLDGLSSWVSIASMSMAPGADVLAA